MEKQAIIRETNRREMLKLSGMGVLGGAAVGALSPAKVRAAAAQPNISYASWIHGHSMQIEYPDRIDFTWRAGFYIRIEGKPGTTNWFHFAIPTPVIIDDVRLRIDAAMLRFVTGSVDAFVRDVDVYDGEKLIASHKNVNLSEENAFAKFVVPERPLVRWGIGISIGVAFGVEMMPHRMEFISAGCDFTLREPEEPQP
jgi:hypothetical protein